MFDGIISEIKEIITWKNLVCEVQRQNIGEKGEGRGRLLTAPNFFPVKEITTKCLRIILKT